MKVFMMVSLVFLAGYSILIVDMSNQRVSSYQEVLDEAETCELWDGTFNFTDMICTQG